MGPPRLARCAVGEAPSPQGGNGALSPRWGHRGARIHRLGLPGPSRPPLTAPPRRGRALRRLLLFPSGRRPAPRREPKQPASAGGPRVTAGAASPAPSPRAPARPSDAAAGRRLPRGVRAAALHGVAAHQPQAPRPARGACGGEWPPVAAPPPPGPLGRPEPVLWRAGPRSRRTADVPFSKWRATCRRPARHCLCRGPRGPALFCTWLLPGPESEAAGTAPASRVPAVQGSGALLNPRGIPGMRIFLFSVFPMSQLRNRKAEKLCRGDRGRWPCRARRPVLAGSRGGGSREGGPSRQDPPRQLGTGRWPV